MNDVVVADAVGFRFAGGAGVDDVTLSLRAGRITGFLGRNGAGKSTTMRLLAGVLQPQRGSVKVLGHAATSAAARALVGWAPEEPPLSPALTVREQLRFAAALAARGASHTPRPIDDVVVALDLGASIDRLAGVLSKGTRQRVGTALALVGAPAVILLDEPGAGLDPAQVLALRTVLRAARDDGAAILLSSHVVAEVAALADDVVAIDAGRIVHSGGIATLDVAVAAITPHVVDGAA